MHSSDIASTADTNSNGGQILFIGKCIIENNNSQIADTGKSNYHKSTELNSPLQVPQVINKSAKLNLLLQALLIANKNAKLNASLANKSTKLNSSLQVLLIVIPEKVSVEAPSTKILVKSSTLKLAEKVPSVELFIVVKIQILKMKTLVESQALVLEVLEKS
ncbi:hypothetical protein C1646_761496 [Rhizophagus diaphanus]|nr:hypothetical protein C1646_761496 [Rhizophagus diaphanus] [Rhizophagus sp. MUCL 43196]